MNPLRILIVEDDALNANEIEVLLEDIGYIVVGKARSGERALELMAEEVPDMILVDIDLRHGRGKMDGIDLALAIRKKYTLPLIFITGSLDSSTMKKTLAAQPEGYITKPVSEGQLEFNIADALAKVQQAYNRPQPLLADHIFVRVGKAYVKVAVADIHYVKSVGEGQYLNIHGNEGKLLVSTNLSNFLRQCEHPDLLRVHRSYIININHIESFEEQTVMVANQLIHIGKNYQGHVQRQFQFLKTNQRKKKK